MASEAEQREVELEIVQGGERRVLRIDESDVIHFPHGLVGCQSWQRFVLLQVEEDDLVQVLYCLDEPGISLLVTDPARIVPDYSVDLSEADRATLGVDAPDEVRILAILVVDHSSGAITANLLGPLVLSCRQRIGIQLVLVDSPYSARHPVGTLLDSMAAAQEC